MILSTLEPLALYMMKVKILASVLIYLICVMHLQLTDLSKTILEIRTVLYGDGESEPNPDACSQVTQEFFRDDTFRLLIIFLPNLKLGVRNHAFLLPILQLKWLLQTLPHAYIVGTFLCFETPLFI